MRKVLDKGDVITLYDYVNNEERVFQITDLQSDVGGSVVVYRAWHDNGSFPGILKEYYPLDYCEKMSRNSLTGGLFFDDDNVSSNVERFKLAKENYLKIFKELKELYNKESVVYPYPFIPYFELFLADKNNDSASVYVWTPTNPVKTFEELIDNNNSSELKSEVNSKYKVYTIVSAFCDLSRSISILHSKKLVHRDISPENFGFQMSGGRALTQSIQLIDVDSICEKTDENILAISKKGFTEKTHDFKNPSMLDVYSIGACLFYAINTNDTDRSYDDSRYGDIDEIVDSSKLFIVIHDKSYDTLKAYIKFILKKCLSPYHEYSDVPRFIIPNAESDEMARHYLRYSSMARLHEDLSKALSQADSYERINATVANNKWQLSSDMIKSVIDDIEETHLRKKMALLYHYYQVPLYDFVDNNTFNVIVWGMGENSFFFLDTLLQLVQNLNLVEFSVKVMMNTFDRKIDIDSDAEIYLSERPEIKNFFNVTINNDVVSENNEAYGYIEFVESKLTELEGGFIKHINVADILNGDNEKVKYDYAFVDLSDYVNMQVAYELKEYVKAVNCFYDNNVVAGDNDIPISIKLADVFEKDDELMRMAFNTHIVWKDDLNIDFEKEKEAFNKNYNRLSSLSYVLSLKYKLHSFGIEMAGNVYDAANSFAENFNSEEIDNYAYMEHKRWVVEKICEGWTVLPINEYDVTDDNIIDSKDENSKRHICIVRSSAKRGLYKIKHSEWDKIDEDKLDKMDELDRVSILFHQLCAKKVDEQFGVKEIQEIKNFCDNKTELNYLFDNWETSYREMIRRVDDDLTNNCLATWKLMWKGIEADSDYDKSVDEFKKIKQKFDIKRYVYKDFKEFDYNLIKKIPFILTYSENKTLVVPMQEFEDIKKEIKWYDRNQHRYVYKDIIPVDKIYENICVAGMMNPKRICFIYSFKERGENTWPYLENGVEILRRSLNYIDIRGLRSEVKIIAVFDDELGNNYCERTKKNIDKLVKKRINRKIECCYIMHNTFQQVSVELENKEDILVQLFNEYTHSGGFQYNLWQQLSWFITDINKEISLPPTDRKDVWIKYIDDTRSLSAREINALSGGTNEMFSDGIGFDEIEGDTLLGIYKKYPDMWKRLCGQLKEEDDEIKYKIRIGGFEPIKRKGPKSVKTCILPMYTYNGIQKLLQCLMKYDYVKSYEMHESDMDSYIRIECKCYDNAYKEINRIISNNMYCFVDSEAISAQEDGDNLVIFLYKYDIDINDIAEAEQLVDTLVANGFICGYKNNLGYQHLKFTEKNSLRLFTSDSCEGTMLEYQTYDECKSSGYFDNVILNLSLKANSPSRFETEIDCLVIKGSKIVLIECKARNDIPPEDGEEMRVKLRSRLNAIGFGTVGVFLIDGYGEIICDDDDICVKKLSDINKEFTKGEYPIAEYVNDLIGD